MEAVITWLKKYKELVIFGLLVIFAGILVLFKHSNKELAEVEANNKKKPTYNPKDPKPKVDKKIESK